MTSREFCRWLEKLLHNLIPLGVKDRPDVLSEAKVKVLTRLNEYDPSLGSPSTFVKWLVTGAHIDYHREHRGYGAQKAGAERMTDLHLPSSWQPEPYDLFMAPEDRKFCRYLTDGKLDLKAIGALIGMTEGGASYKVKAMAKRVRKHL